MRQHISFSPLRALVFIAAAFLTLRCAAAPIVEFPILNVGADPEGITLGPDGALWFTEFQANQIGRIDTNGVITNFPVNPPAAYPVDITTGPNGFMWFTAYNGNSIGRIDTNGAIQEFPLPSDVIGRGLTFGPDNRLWILDYGTLYTGQATNGGIVALTIISNMPSATNYYNSNLTVHSRPGNIVAGPDGKLYFTEELAGKIGQITTNGLINEVTLSNNCEPYGITVGPDGNLWFTEYASNKLGRLTTSLNLTEFGLPFTNSPGFVFNGPYRIITGPDSNLWYTDFPDSSIWQVTLGATNLSATQYMTPTLNSFPTGIAVGADSNIWFGEFVNDYVGAYSQIGRFYFPVPLSIQLTNTNVVISWTTNIGPGSTLLTNSDLTTNHWGALLVNPSVVSNRYVVTNPISGINRLFFRLNQ